MKQKVGSLREPRTIVQLDSFICCRPRFILASLFT